MNQFLVVLSRTLRVGAEVRGLAFRTLERGPAHRAFCGKGVGLRSFWALLEHNSDNFGNDAARLTNHYRIAHSQI